MEGYGLIQTNHNHILSEIMDNVCVPGIATFASPYQEIPSNPVWKDFHAQSKRNDRLVSQSVASISLLPAQRDLFDPLACRQNTRSLLKS